MNLWRIPAANVLSCILKKIPNDSKKQQRLVTKLSSLSWMTISPSVTENVRFRRCCLPGLWKNSPKTFRDSFTAYIWSSDMSLTAHWADAMSLSILTSRTALSWVTSSVLKTMHFDLDADQMQHPEVQHSCCFVQPCRQREKKPRSRYIPYIKTH